MSDTEIVCPKCSSNQLSADKRGFSAGNAVKGLAAGLIGIPGGILWGLKGKDNVIITCLKCGKQFKPGEGKVIPHIPITNKTKTNNPQVDAKLIAQEMEKARELYEKEERKKERENARLAKEREKEKEQRAEEKRNEKEYIASISIDSALKRKVRAASLKDLEIFADKINKEIKRVAQLKDTAERQEEILKMKERVNEVQSEIEAREKDRDKKEARRIEKKELKKQIKIAEQELLTAQENLVKVNAFHLLRTQAQKEKQVQDQEKVIHDIKAKIAEMKSKLSDNVLTDKEPSNIETI